MPCTQVFTEWAAETNMKRWAIGSVAFFATKSEKCDAKNYEAFPENDSLKVEYFFSLKKFKEGEELFTALRDAWKPHGNLLQNSHGNISYRSGLIKFHNDEQVR